MHIPLIFLLILTLHPSTFLSQAWVCRRQGVFVKNVGVICVI